MSDENILMHFNARSDLHYRLFEFNDFIHVFAAITNPAGTF